MQLVATGGKFTEECVAALEITQPPKQSNSPSRRHQQGRMEQSDEKKTEGLCEHIKVTSTWEDKQMVTEKPEHKHAQIFVNSTSQADHQKVTQPGQFLLTQAPQHVCHCTCSISSGAQVGIPGGRDRRLRNIAEHLLLTDILSLACTTASKHQRWWTRSWHR